MSGILKKRWKNVNSTGQYYVDTKLFHYVVEKNNAQYLRVGRRRLKERWLLSSVTRSNSEQYFRANCFSAFELLFSVKNSYFNLFGFRNHSVTIFARDFTHDFDRKFISIFPSLLPKDYQLTRLYYTMQTCLHCYVVGCTVHHIVIKYYVPFTAVIRVYC